MKILLTVDPEIPVPPKGYGGIERIVDMIIKKYIQKGHEVTLCAHPHSQVECSHIKWKGLRSQNLPDVIKNTLQLARLVYSGKFDVLHSFSRLAYLTPLLPTSLPKIMSYQREPTLSQVKKAVRIAKKGTLIFTGCSNYITDQVATVAAAKTIYNCAPVENYDAKFEVETDAPLIFLGRIEPIKGTDVAVRIALQTGRRLIIAGNISEGHEMYYEEKVKPFLNSRIEYVGTVNDEQKNELLGKSLALLMPIQWNEPFGIVMAEAMACGSPVIGFGRGSIPEVVTHNVNGFIARDENEMASFVHMCGSLNRRRIREIAEERFSDETISDVYLHLYTELAFGVRTKSSQ